MEMENESPSTPPLRLSQLMDVQVQAIESLLNSLGTHGLRLHPGEDKAGQWQWQWCGKSARANGLGTAIITATYWYFGLLSDVEAGVTGDT